MEKEGSLINDQVSTMKLYPDTTIMRSNIDISQPVMKDLRRTNDSQNKNHQGVNGFIV
jgi:hypothetical protein